MNNAKCVEDIPKDLLPAAAFWWAREIGDKDLMRPLVTEQYWAYVWARDIGDKEVMRELITDSECAHRWAQEIGDKDLMRPLLKGTRYEGKI